MNIRQLEAFCKVMETGSMSEAGRLLGVTQPAISKSIRTLEKGLKMTLFKRSGDKLYPSLEAQRLYPNARRIFEELQSTIELSRKLRATEAGTLRIAATYAVTTAYISDAFAAFHKARPLIDLQFIAMPPRQIIDMVASMEADIGLLYEPITTPTVSQVPLCEVEMICLLPKQHYLCQKKEITPADLVGESVISFPESSYSGELLKSQSALVGSPWKPGIVVNQAQVAKSLAGAGIGIAVIDSLTLDGRSKENFTVRSFRPRTVLLVSAIITAGRPYSLLCKEFIDIMHEVVRLHARRSEGVCVAAVRAY